MAELKYLQIDDNLESYYITLCDIYFYHVSQSSSEDEKTKTAGTIDQISSLIFHAITVGGTTIREMDNEKYEKEYKRFYNDIMSAIKECSENDVVFDSFLEIIDEIVGAALKLASAFEKLGKIKEENQEATDIETEEKEDEEEVVEEEI
ncbi:hypothetical protein ACFYKX_01925 [Cytobacillus sp. FJAT-54145]|uniref:Uncharacterized protein n=1 Tax=Cytobacillus spartinae TaxID=3299023 RepID=A0ABW6K5B4_9BACI